MPLSRTIMIAVGSLLLGAAIGAYGVGYFMLKANRRVISLTYSEASFQTIERLQQLDQLRVQQAQKGLYDSLAIYARELERLSKLNDEAGWIAKRTLTHIEPLKSNAMYFQAVQEAKKPFVPEPFIAR